MSLLFSPFKIRGVELRNRIVMAPTGTGFGNVGGTASDKTMNFYARRAMGGVGMIILETTTVDPSGLISKTRLRIDDDRFIEGLSILTRKIKAHGARVAIQLSHRGGQATKEEIGDTPVAPSSVLAPGFREKPRELSAGEIRKLVETFAEAARRAKQAGFDAVEVHGAHGHLICQFLSGATNFRKDEFGGDIEGRTRFAREIVGRIKMKIGGDFPVIFRISADEHMENGIKLEEAKIMAQLLEKAGVDLFHVSGGHYSNLYEWVVPPMMQPPGCLVPLAAGIKGAVSVPVMAVGKIHDPLLAESILQEGKADLIATSRALIADPDFPQKVLEKREKEIRRCIACNTCIDSRVRLKSQVRCAVNPEVGKEGGDPYKPTSAPKKVLVIGGGPGGMEAARVAKIRGHQVTLWEQADRLGGQLLLAAKAPSKLDMQNIIDYYKYQLEKLGVVVQLKKKATLPLIEEMNPEATVVAAGVYPGNPEIEGIDRSNVVRASEVLGEKVELTGKRIVIIGGGAGGCETAEFLRAKGFTPTIVEMLEDIGGYLQPTLKEMFRRKLSLRGVEILTRSKATRVEEGRVVFQDEKGKEQSIGANIVILATGSRSNDGLMKALREKGRPFFPVGDCIEPRKVIDAIHEGFSVGCQI